MSPRRFSTLAVELTALQSHRGEQKLLLALPAADFEGTFAPRIRALFDKGLLDGGVAQNAPHAALIDGIKIAFYLTNAANPQSVSALYEMGYDYVIASLELSRAQLRDLIFATGSGVYGYGRAQMMQLRHCPLRHAAQLKQHTSLLPTTLRPIQAASSGCAKSTTPHHSCPGVIG